MPRSENQTNSRLQDPTIKLVRNKRYNKPFVTEIQKLGRREEGIEQSEHKALVKIQNDLTYITYNLYL